MPKSLRNELLFLIAVVTLAMTVRAAFTGLPRVVRWDEAGYQMIARQPSRRSRLRGSCRRTRPAAAPGGRRISSAAGKALGFPIPWSTAALAHVLLGGLIPIPVYLLGRDLKSRRIGAIAALLVALHPALAVSPLYWSTMTEPPYVLFMLCGTYAGWRAARDGAWSWFLGMGAFFGLAYLTRPEAVAYLLALLVFVLIWRGPAALRRARVRRDADPKPRERRLASSCGSAHRPSSRWSCLSSSVHPTSFTSTGSPGAGRCQASRALRWALRGPMRRAARPSTTG